jgi:cytidylate kinase
MDIRTIAISRSLGAGGEEVGLKVADSLGFRYVDDEIVRRAAEAAGVSPETVARSEQTPPLIRRILEVMAAAPAVEAGAWTPEFAYEVAPLSYYGELIRQVIYETANEGKAIILAHGASMALAGSPGVLRVFVTASPEVRARRVAAATKVDEGQAMKLVKDSDNQRRQYFKRFYGLAQELPVHYDLVINTDALTVDQAAQVLLSAAKA